MSAAALQFPAIWASGSSFASCHLVTPSVDQSEAPETLQPVVTTAPVISLAFYRKHTESLLRRYLYASMLVGRSPSMLDHPIARGWASSRPVRTFEDAVNFVLDIEKCIEKLPLIDRQLLSRIVLQEYTVGEASAMFGLSINSTATKLSVAVDRLTGILLKAKLLILPS